MQWCLCAVFFSSSSFSLFLYLFYFCLFIYSFLFVQSRSAGIHTGKIYELKVYFSRRVLSSSNRLSFDCLYLCLFWFLLTMSVVATTFAGSVGAASVAVAATGIDSTLGCLL